MFHNQTQLQPYHTDCESVKPYKDNTIVVYLLRVGQWALSFLFQG